jgi:hypothetical protein
VKVSVSEGFNEGFKQVRVSSKWRLQARFQWRPGFETRIWGQGLRQLQEATQRNNSNNFKKQLKEATQTTSRGNSNLSLSLNLNLLNLLTFCHSQWSNAQTGWMSW